MYCSTCVLWSVFACSLVNFATLLKIFCSVDATSVVHLSEKRRMVAEIKAESKLIVVI